MKGRWRGGRAALLALLTGLVSGCGSLLSGMAGDLAGNLSAAIIDNDDPKVVETGAPAYLLMMDAVVRQSGDDANLLMAAASLNSAYAGAFIKEPARKRSMTQKAMNYGQQALCVRDKSLCHVQEMDIATFRSHLDQFGKGDLPLLFNLGTVWAGWVQARSEDWNAVADLPRIQALMERVLALDEKYQEGAAHLYLGGLETLLPPALGGRQEEGRAHLERAIELSGGHNLMAKVVLARQYARARYDRDLHDRLLNDVVAADTHAPGWTLANCLAQEEARTLLKSADDYF